MPSELDKLKDKCQALGVGTVGCKTIPQYRAALDAQAPGWQAAETPQQPSTVIAQARARAASSGRAAPSRASLAPRSKAAAWLPGEQDKLLVAFEDGKTGQELADAVGGGRTAAECARRLKELTPPSARLLAYDWDPKKPRKHTAKIRASLPAAEQNLSKAALTKLWKPESREVRIDAVKRILNVNLGELWVRDENTLNILVETGLPPAAFAKRPGFHRPPLRQTEPFKRHSDGTRGLMRGVQSNRRAREAMLSGKPLRSPYAWVNDDGTRMDQACYNEMYTKGCLLAAIALGANEETEMPRKEDKPEIVGWTTHPSFERLDLPRAKTSFAEASYARQFCYICGSLFVLKGGRVFVEHCKKRKHKRGVHGFCCMCNTGVLFFADVIRAAVEKEGLPRSVALKAVDRLADAFEVTDGVIDDCF